jgi:hypothetical protein
MSNWIRRIKIKLDAYLLHRVHGILIRRRFSTKGGGGIFDE